MNWLLHMSTLKLPWLDFAGEKFWREDKIAKVRVADSQPQPEGVQYSIASIVSVTILFC